MSSLSELNRWRVAELRSRLESAGLPTNGLKQDLVHRLYEHFKEEKQAAEQNKNNDEVPDNATNGVPSQVSQSKDPQSDDLESMKQRLLQDLTVNNSGSTHDREVDEDQKLKRMLKNKKKRERKKNRKDKSKDVSTAKEVIPPKPASDDSGVEIEYVTEDPDFNDPQLFMFRKIFQAFKIAEEVAQVKKEQTEAKSEIAQIKEKIAEKTRGFGADSDDEVEKADSEGGEKMSKKKLRRINRLSVAELKQLVSRPDVVEMHDVTALDPKLLVHLKATRNSVSVPRHWCFKRKYLQGKRGFEKPPFELPECIKNTGIMEMRQALQDKEDQRTLKSKMREKVRPKLGKIDIDYQKLHDAFFRYQTKPKMTIHGDLYYEGKEFETRLKEKKPGNLSDELRTALGMPVGAHAQKTPPPWLIAMQRYGPPPSYPNLKIPGLNCPIPDGCSFGYHAGGWGKPPVDEHGRPLYGNVFGTQSTEFNTQEEDDDIDRGTWGELESESEEESSEEEESEDEEKANPDESGFVTPAESGMITPSGISTVPSGMETPDMIELRKKKIEDAMEGGETPQLYQVLPEKAAAGIGRSMMGSAHVYDVNAPRRGVAAGAADMEGVEVALNPEELELDTVAMAAKYEQRVREQELVQKEDFSDMVAEHAAKQKKKRKAQTQDTGRATKKYKEFKF